MRNACGWSEKGKGIYGEVSGKCFARESFIAAKCGSEILAPLCYKGICDTKFFNLWIEDFLIPVLKPGQVVIFDNATFHKSPKTKKLIEGAGCTLLFLPPYSPDYNPIKIFWAHFKAKIKSIIHDFSKVSEAIDFAFST